LIVDPRDFLDCVIRPVLARLALGGAAAETLLLGTALHESGGLRRLRQAGGGPALGLYQIEPATHADILENFLAFRPDLAARVAGLAAQWPGRVEQLATNPAYATAIARIHYRRRPEPLPEAGDIAALGRYWKRHYNTGRGRGTAEAFIESWRRWMT